MRTLQGLLQIMVGPQVPRSLPHGRPGEATEQHYVRPVAACVRVPLSESVHTHVRHLHRGVEPEGTTSEDPPEDPASCLGRVSHFSAFMCGGVCAFHYRNLCQYYACFGIHLGAGLEEEQRPQSTSMHWRVTCLQVILLSALRV